MLSLLFAFASSWKAHRTYTTRPNYPKVSSDKNLNAVVTKKKSLESNADTLGMRIANAAKSVIGRKYRYYKSGPNKFDIPGLISFAHKTVGIPLERIDFVFEGKVIQYNFVQPGDIIFKFSEGLGIVTKAVGYDITYVTVSYGGSVHEETKCVKSSNAKHVYRRYWESFNV